VTLCPVRNCRHHAALVLVVGVALAPERTYQPNRCVRYREATAWRAARLRNDPQETSAAAHRAQQATSSAPGSVSDRYDAPSKHQVQGMNGA